MVKKIAKKKVGQFTYELKNFEGDNKFVIYRIDDSVMSDGGVHRIPEEAVFDNEAKARAYLERL